MSVQRVPLYLSPEHGCGYLKDREAINAFVDPKWKLDPERYGYLLDQGYRRSGQYVYKPACRGCSACESARIPAENFNPSRSQRRIWKRNLGVSAQVLEAKLVEEHFELYGRYLRSRHADGQMDPDDLEAYQTFLWTDWCETRLVEFRDGQKLVGVTVIDLVPQGLSAVYSFFEPDEASRSPGKLALLWLIAECQRLGIPYVYLGYAIADCAKMNYKTNFSGVQLFRDDAWHALNESGSWNIIAPRSTGDITKRA